MMCKPAEREASNGTDEQGSTPKFEFKGIYDSKPDFV